MKIYFATKNIGKFNSLKNILSKYGIKLTQVPLDLPEPRSDNLQKIVKEKILFA